MWWWVGRDGETSPPKPMLDSERSQPETIKTTGSDAEPISNVKVGGVATVASQTCLQGRVGVASVQVVNLQGC